MSESKLTLPYHFTFYFRITDKRILSEHNLLSIDYKDSIKTIAKFNTVEEFWKVFQRIKKPEQYKIGLDLLLFKDNIKPMWEDDCNKNGGKISLKLKKEYTCLIWEEIVIDFIGNLFTESVCSKINGIILSMRRDYNFIQIWFKDYSVEFGKEIEKEFRKVLNIPDEVEVDVKAFK
jgi:translation initiation factor 4E